MQWTFNGRAGLLSFGETGRPGASAILVQLPAAGVAAVPGLFITQADFISLPVIRSFGLQMGEELRAAPEASLKALAFGVAAANGLDRVRIEGATVPQQTNSARDLLAEFEAWKAGGQTQLDATPVATGPTISLEDYRHGSNLQLLGNRVGSVYPGPRVPRLGQPLDGFRIAAVVRDLGQGAFAADPFVIWAGGQLDRVDLDAARTALSCVSHPSNRSVSWYGDRNHPSHGDRLQAAASMPVLAGIISDTGTLADAVDRRISLQPLLTGRTGLSKGALKRLAKLKQPLPAGIIFEDRAVGRDALQIERIRRLSLRGRLDEDRACRILAELPPDWTPQTDSAWRAFHDVASGAAVPLDEVANIPISKTLGASKGDWEGFRATLARAADMDPEAFGRREIALTTSDAIEVVDELARHVILPLVLTSIDSTGQPEGTPLENDVANARRVAFDLVAGGAKSPATALFETARRWMSRIPALQALTGEAMDAAADVPFEERFAAYEEGTWPALCEPFHASNGLVLRPLTRRDLLTEESARLDHCVGRLYQSKSLNGQCHIVSVQSLDGRTSHSTIEIAPPARGQLVLTETQHRARSNSTPSEAARTAAQEFYRAVREGLHTLNSPEIQEWADFRSGVEPQAVVARMASWSGALGIPYRDEDLRTGLWQEWRDIVGGDLARLEGPDGLYRFKAVRDLVDAMSPAAAKILRDQAAERRRQAEPAEAPGP